MSTKTLQSLCAAVFVIGLVLLVAGMWGSHSQAPAPQAVAQPTPAPELTPQTLADAVPLSTPEPTAAPTPTPQPTQPPQISTPTPTPQAATPTPEPKAKRSLSDTQRRQILDALKKHAGKSIIISSASPDDETKEFAETLKHVFTDAGWHVDGVKQISPEHPPTGLSIAAGGFPSPENAAAAFRAISAAGFHVTQQLDSKLTGGKAELIVGKMQ